MFLNLKPYDKATLLIIDWDLQPRQLLTTNTCDHPQLNHRVLFNAPLEYIISLSFSVRASLLQQTNLEANITNTNNPGRAIPKNWTDKGK